MRCARFIFAIALAGCGRWQFDVVDKGSSDAAADANSDATGDGNTNGHARSSCNWQRPAVPAPTGRTIYIATNGNDANADGTMQRPYATLGAIEDVITAGDEVVYMPGTYSRQLVDFSGTEQKPIVIRSLTRGAATITGTGSANEFDGALALNNQSNLVIDGFVINSNIGRSVSAEAATRVTIQNNDIGNAKSSCVVVSGDNIAVDYNHVHDCELGASGASNGGAAISVNWINFVSTNIRMTRNTIHDVWGQGITLLRTKGAKVEDNTIFNATVNLTLDAVTNVSIERNLMYRIDARYDIGMPTPGIMMSNVDFPVNAAPWNEITDDISVVNNVFMRTNWAFGYYCATRTSGQANNGFDRIDFMHNLVLEQLEGSVYLHETCPGAPAPVQMRVLNNVFQNAPTGAVGAWTTVRNNCIENAEALGNGNGATPPCNVSSVFPPSDVGVTLTTGAPVLGAGTASGVTTDLLCRPRGPAPTIGPYELP